MYMLLTAIATLALFFALILTWGGFDYLGFGTLMTQQQWGDPKQRKPWKTSYSAVEKGIYRLVQHAFIAATALGVYVSFAIYGQIAAVCAVLAYPFMPHDLAYHLVGGHFGHERYNPFSMKHKVKRFSFHYWIVKLFVVLIPKYRRLYHVGVPAKWETLGRMIGTALVSLLVVALVYA